MMTGRDTRTGVAGGLARHIPVLARQAVEFLAIRKHGVYVDATFGGGGYTRAILAADDDAQVLGLDRDRTAIALGADLVDAAGGRLTLVQSPFSALDDAAGGPGRADGVVFDLGVSSLQLDSAERGFSFRLDGPLDMRMGDAGPRAADIVAAASGRDLAQIIATLGEERHARAVARAILHARAAQPIRTTGALAGIVARVVRTRPGDIHPATRTFQALRMFVNDELGELAQGLVAAERVLKPGGRLVVIAFHSLEDRMVKTFLVDRAGTTGVSRHLPDAPRAPATFRVLTKRPVTPEDDEIAANPRARSAKLRAAERTDAPARPLDRPAIPRLPTLAQSMRGS
ncbi:MAG: 16S rRNA (cytosine(1402)-N(4))-methyltransferase RsmH [Rhodoplanes sp.]